VELSLLEEFCDHLKANGLKGDTIAEYACNLQQFSQWCSGLAIESFFDLVPEQILSYFAEVKERYPNSSTSYKKCKAVFGFFEWLKMEGRILLNPSPLPPERKADLLPSVVAEQSTIRNAMIKLEKSGSLVEKRDRVMIDLAYSCGLRRCELHNLDIQDIHGNFLKVTGKGGKQRQVPIGDHALSDLLDYIHHVRPKLCKNGSTSAVFVSWKAGGKRMHLYSINAVFKRLRKKYSFEQSFRPHALRHAFGRDMVRANCPVPKISEIMGHVKYETTQIYTRLAPIDLQKAHEKFHPRG